MLDKSNSGKQDQINGAHKYGVVPDYLLDDVLLNTGVKLKLHYKKKEMMKSKAPEMSALKMGIHRFVFTNTHMKAVYGKICVFKLIKK